MRRLLAPTALLLATLALAACSTPLYRPSGGSTPSQPGTSTPEQPGSAVPEPTLPVVPTPVPPAAPPPKSHRLSPATNALVTQARTATSNGDFDAAAATLERALRIEPDNPLVWIEMGQMRLAADDAVQAENMGRRALALAAGAPREQASAWQLIGAALRARGRNIEAQEALQRAGALVAP